MKALRRVLPVLVLFVSISGTSIAADEPSNGDKGWIVDDTRTANQRLRPLGVFTYRIQRADSAVSVQLLDQEDRTVATVVTRLTRDWSREIHYESPTEKLVIKWTPATGTLRISDGSAAVAERRYDRQTKEVVETAGGATIFERYKDAIARSVEALGDLISHGVNLGVREGADDRLSVQPQWIGTEDPNAILEGYPYAPAMTGSDPYLSGGGGTTCGGSWFRGDAYGWTDPTGTLLRSIICQYAKEDVNVKCWNALCIGCCQHLECDAFCLAGDYFCVTAGMSGRACGRK